MHIYRNCTCLARSGLIGSAAGDPQGTGGDISYSHNNGAGISFSSITIDHCNFASGNIDITVANSLVVTNGTQAGGVETYCPSTIIEQSSLSTSPNPQSEPVVQMAQGAGNLTMENCLVRPTFGLGTVAPVYYGLLLNGDALIQGCTFDLSGISGDSGSYFRQGFIQLNGTHSLSFRNNAYIVPAGEDLPLLYGATCGDALTFDHNAYNLGSGSTIARDYTQANGSSASLTFAQWQGAGPGLRQQQRQREPSPAK